MKIGIFWRRYRNIEFQRKLTDSRLKDDAKSEAYQHYCGLLKAGYKAELIEWNPDPILMVQLIREAGIDLIFNASSFDELCFLETFKIPYVGSGLRTVGMDKAQRKILVKTAGVITPDFVIADHPDRIPTHALRYPLFVKPLNGRGSAGIDETNIVRRPEDLAAVVTKITEKIGQAALIEEFIQGRELTVGVIKTEDPEILPIVEIGYSFGKTNTFDHKMLDQEKITCPAHLSKKTEALIRQQVLLAYKTLNIRDFGRVDLILDEKEIPYFLEVNTFAGLTYPDQKSNAHIGYMGYMAKEAGLTQSSFLSQLVASALARYPQLS